MPSPEFEALLASAATESTLGGRIAAIERRMAALGPAAEKLVPMWQQAADRLDGWCRTMELTLTVFEAHAKRGDG